MGGVVGVAQRGKSVKEEVSPAIANMYDHLLHYLSGRGSVDSSLRAIVPAEERAVRQAAQQEWRNVASPSRRRCRRQSRRHTTISSTTLGPRQRQPLVAGHRTCQMRRERPSRRRGKTVVQCSNSFKEDAPPVITKARAHLHYLGGHGGADSLSWGIMSVEERG